MSRLPPCKPHPELDRLLEKVRAEGSVMSRAEFLAQQKSWVIGELMLSNFEMSRERAEAIYGEVAGRAA